jgi:hypothetical protein
MDMRALLFRISRIAAVVFVLAPLCAAESAAQTRAATKALTVGQVEALIRQGTPDSSIGQQLRSRGLASPVDRPLIDRLTKLGAGPETRAALDHLLPKVRLAIRTAPGADVALDGIPVATVGTGGEIVLAVEPGNYQLLVTKKDHTSVARTVRLVLNQPQTVEAPLAWSVGYLTLDAGFPEAQIAIAGSGRYARRVERLPLSVGPHEIRVTAPMRVAFSTVVVIEGGRIHEVPVTLEIDRAALKPLSDEILRDYSKSDYGMASLRGQVYVQRGGADPEILRVLALSLFQSKLFAKFPDLAAKALAAGVELTFHVTHFHNAFTLRGGHAAELGISAIMIRYTPLAKCNLGSLAVPAAQVQCTLRSTGDSTTLTLILPNTKNPAKGLNLDLVGEAPGELEAIMHLIESSRGAAHAAPARPAP